MTARLSETNFIEIAELGKNLSSEILQAWLTSRNRTLTIQQSEIVRKAFSQCSLPLYVKLIFEQVACWKSYDPLEKMALNTTIQQVINDLFLQIEQKHGTLLVQWTLGYLTASKGSLSEGELEDLLSLDDEVLTDVFQYHIPAQMKPACIYMHWRLKFDKMGSKVG